MAEKLGSGLPAVFKSYQDRNLKEPSIIEGENFIKYILPREKLAEPKKEQDLILHLFNSAAKITIADVIHALKISRTSAGRKLEKLVREGKLERVGVGRGSSYIMR
jgi:predicted HTH transcriptional regulator